ncbi:radical SAM protein [bacterium]|nr:radical SAM protein [bacterium]
MSKIICKNPFYYCDIGIDGNVYVCCNKWCKFYSIGNILQDDFSEIVSGTKLNEFVQQFVNQEFKHCRIDTCMGAQSVDENGYEYLFDEYSQNKKRQIRLNFDTSCNVQCIFCRHDFEMADAQQLEQTEKLIERIKSFLPEMDKNHCEISLNGVGEVFVSKPFLDLIKHITDNYKNIKFQIITNGVLCSKEMLEKLGIIDRISGIEVSVHAASEKTYNKQIKGGNFKRVSKNLEYISQLKLDRKIERFQMNFAINVHNYREMISFAKWGIKLGAQPSFLPLLILSENERMEFDKLNVADLKHSEYNKFVKIIKKLKPLRNKIMIPEHYFKLETKKEKSRIRKFFKI